MTVKSCGKLQQNLNLGFQFTLPKNDKISSSRREGRNFKFLWLVLPKRWITWAKNWHSSFPSWQWRTLKGFSKIWVVLSFSGFPKMMKFLWADELVEISPSSLKEILPFFGRLNWKPGVRFCWNFPQPFTVRTGTCCVTFLLRQFLF